MSFDTPLPGTSIIVDIGSAYVKVGFAGSTSGPRHVFPTITGTEKYQAVMADVSTRSIYVGDDAMKMRGVLKVKYPIQRGQIMDWNDYYEILNHIFYTLLRIESLSYYPVIYIDAPYVPHETKAYIARVLFETHSAQSLIMAPSSIFALADLNLRTGLVVESGDGTTWIVPVIEGQIQTNAIQRLNLGGWDVNQNLMALLMREGISFASSASAEILKEIKEKNCYFVLDPNNPPSTSGSTEFPLPDGSTLAIPEHLLYEAPEVMFQPAMLGYNIMNIPQAIMQSLRMVDSQYWGDLLSKIILVGGNCTYSGFEERLKQELNVLIPQLGPIPKATSSQQQASAELKLESITIGKKEKDTCPSCGELVDLSDGKEFCPACGAKMVAEEIPIDLDIGKKKERKPKRGKCPHCGKSLKDDSSVFCPFCGKNIEKLPDLDEVEQLIEQKLASTPDEFSGFYDSNEEIIKFRNPNNFLFSTFNGAAKLGTKQAFKDLMITYEVFQSDANQLYRDFSLVL